MAGMITIGGISANLVSGETRIGPITISGKTQLGERIALELKAGDNVVTVPTGAYACLIVFPQTFTEGEVKIRSSKDPSDTGLPVNTIAPVLFALPSGVTSLTINGAVTGVSEVVFI